MRFCNAFEFANLGFYMYRESVPNRFYTVRHDTFSNYIEVVYISEQGKVYVENMLSISVNDMLKNDWNIAKTYRKDV